MEIQCDYCGKAANYPTGHVNRARKNGNSLYCGRVCSGLGRRHNKTLEMKRLEKALYDQDYRDKNIQKIKARNQEYNKTPEGRAMQKRNRDKRMDKHIEYCRQPEYKEYKKKYDRSYRSVKDYGEEWGPVMETLLYLDDEVKTRVNRYEIYQANGTLNKHQGRKRDYAKTVCHKS